MSELPAEELVITNPARARPDPLSWPPHLLQAATRPFYGNMRIVEFGKKRVKFGQGSRRFARGWLVFGRAWGRLCCVCQQSRCAGGYRDRISAVFTCPDMRLIDPAPPNGFQTPRQDPIHASSFDSDPTGGFCSCRT
ncbi:hypothetical protein Bbelb_142460 [Branchiostoma belcheri]|nr:hypothetical protein Bbelb_142460 [Branchiostoma belcheri]